MCIWDYKRGHSREPKRWHRQCIGNQTTYVIMRNSECTPRSLLLFPGSLFINKRRMGKCSGYASSLCVVSVAKQSGTCDSPPKAKRQRDFCPSHSFAPSHPTKSLLLLGNGRYVSFMSRLLERVSRGIAGGRRAAVAAHRGIPVHPTPLVPLDLLHYLSCHRQVLKKCKLS